MTPTKRKSADSTVALLRDPYRFVSRRAAELGDDVFETRLLLRRTTCMTGPEAAGVFYDPARFQRAGAAPPPLQKTLFGQGGVQGLDGEHHRQRKAMFLQINHPDRVAALAEVVTRDWDRSVADWTAASEIDLYPQVRLLLTRAVCDWAGVPLPKAEVETRTRHLTALFDDAGDIGLGHLRSRAARKAAERWAADVIEQIRSGRLTVPSSSAASVIADHREPNGRPMSRRIAAVELLNVLRPTVATAVYIIFVAHALDAHPSWRERLVEGEGREDAAFVEEVRRFTRSSLRSPRSCVRTSSGGATTSPKADAYCWTCTEPTTTPKHGSTRHVSTQNDSSVKSPTRSHSCLRVAAIPPCTIGARASPSPPASWAWHSISWSDT